MGVPAKMAFERPSSRLESRRLPVNSALARHRPLVRMPSIE
jgi:hypothetical protein